MTNEEKRLLLQDLCARLSCGVKIHIETLEFGELIGTLDAIYPTEERVIADNLNKTIAPINVRCGGFKIEENSVKPYLRSMRSMTEVEKLDFNELQRYNVFYSTKGHYTEVDWLNAHHFDYRGLIEKGLALEASEGMY